MSKKKMPEGTVIEKTRRSRSGKRNAIDIGGVIKARRVQLKMPMIELAKKVGISQAQISRLENNRQGFRSQTLIKIAGALKLKPWVLFMTEIERAVAEKVIGLGR